MRQLVALLDVMQQFHLEQRFVPWTILQMHPAYLDKMKITLVLKRFTAIHKNIMNRLPDQVKPKTKTIWSRHYKSEKAAC